MPEMDGYEATRIIKRNLNKNIKIVGLSANVFAEDKRKAQSAGMDDDLEKPIIIVKEENKILRTAAALSESKLMFESKESEVLRLVKEKKLKLFSPSEPPFELHLPKDK